MAKKNEEKTVEKKTYTVEEELEMLNGKMNLVSLDDCESKALLRSIDASLKTIVAFLPKEPRVIPGLTPPKP